MEEDLVYSILFLLMGAIGIIWAQSAPKTQGDPFAIKISQYTMGIVAILAGLYLLFKALTT
jgi:hypothetical protein